MITNEKYTELSERFRKIFYIKPYVFFLPLDTDTVDKFFDMNKFIAFLQATTTYDGTSDLLEFISTRFGKEGQELIQEIIDLQRG